MGSKDKKTSQEHLQRVTDAIKKAAEEPEELPDEEEAPTIKDLFEKEVLTTEDLPSTTDPRVLLRKIRR